MERFLKNVICSRTKTLRSKKNSQKKEEEINNNSVHSRTQIQIMHGKYPGKTGQRKFENRNIFSGYELRKSKKNKIK